MKIVAGFAVGFSLLTGMVVLRAGFDLREFQWKQRVILLFYSSGESSEFRQQMEVLEGDRKGVSARDLLLVRLPEEGFGRAEDLAIERSKVEELYKEFRVAPGEFRFILIGKDGTQKLNQKSPVELEQLFGLIDSMPMRQREMREGGA